ncbi:hypothetical protein C349_05351 [Cryptococcus neoformans var. grubii Br795]|nr:hypothetical protein C349_06282 [Cryptococcus neoformans var. grubii Br795]OXG77163.1 hypothetical protein C349_05351 [Cryptococcus neoformans var. grubii Br795]
MAAFVQVPITVTDVSIR